MNLSASVRLRIAVLFALLPVVACTHRTKAPVAPDLRPLQDATNAINEVSRGQNAIPDAVLNATKCVVVVPALHYDASAAAPGVATCREKQRWSAPLNITFSGKTGQTQPADLLVLLLSDSGARSLRTGQLRVTPSPAPLVSTSPIPTQVDLTRESLTYEAVKGILSSSKATGVVSQDAARNAAANVVTADQSANDYHSALDSFFNSIVPTGIVIHHTAVLPEGHTPRSARDVDRYHKTRGFEITCQHRVYHVAYHYLILADGRVQSGRPERCEGAHAQGYNSYLGISVVGDFSSRDNPGGKKGLDKPTEQQIASLVRLCRELQGRYAIPLQHIVRHSDISSTSCPGDRFPFATFLRALSDQATPVKSGNG
jgi:N-acetylmuramoyl-L-alanine amidase